MEARRLAYLEAMGIDVWVPRQARLPAAPAEAAPHITVGEGDSDILCLARSHAESKLTLAADIARAMRSPPLWAWPADEAESDGEATTVPRAVAERLFTRILVFGDDLATTLFGNGAPEVIAGARVHVVPDLDRLGRDREAKRILWAVMCEHGIAAPRKPGASQS